MNAKVDRLSSLSDDIIHKILSYNDTKDAIKTSILSSRWKNTWKSTSHLDLSYYHDSLLPKFYESINRVMLSRNDEIELTCVKLGLSEKVSQAFVKKIMNYVFSHNVQKMSIICFYSYDSYIEFPLSLLVSQSLTNLTLNGGNNMIRSTWNLPSLTTLHLDHIKFQNENPDESGGLFSKCPNLKNLTLIYCEIYVDNFIISHSQLTKLALENVDWYYDVYVITPHLKDLTVVKLKENFKEDPRNNLMISAPELTSLIYASKSYFEFSVDGNLSSLEKVDFYICHPEKEEAPKIIDVLQQFHNVKYLTLGLEIIEVLASSVQLLSHLPSPFAKLTSFVIYPSELKEIPTLISILYEFNNLCLVREVEDYLRDVPPHAKLTRFKIYPANLHSKEEGETKLNMPSEVKSYLLHGSPSANITIFSREEVLELQNALLNAVFTQKVMAELQIELEHEKLSCETIRTHADNIKAPLKRHDANMNVQGETQIDDEQKLVKEEISEIRKGWNDVSVQIKQGKNKIDDILLTLDLIESLVKVLPASSKDRIHEWFFRLRADAYNVTKLILDCMKITCEKKVSGLFVRF